MNRLADNKLYQVLQTNNSDLKQYLDLAPGLKKPKLNSSANGKLTTPKPASFRRSLPTS